MTSAAVPRRHHDPFSRSRSRAEALLIRGVLRGLRALALPAATRLGARVVGAGFDVSGRLRDIGLANLALAFPEASDEWRRSVLREAFRNLGRMAAEVAHFRFLTGANVRDLVGFMTAEDESRWQRCMSGSQGVMIATGHFGNWELLAQSQGLMGHPIHLVHRALRNPELDDLLREIRQVAGTGVIYKHAAAREAIRQLRAGEVVAIPVDQHQPGASGIPIPFFGRSAATTPGPARLAQLTEVPIRVAVLVRSGASNHHSIVIGEPVEQARTGNRAADLQETMTRVSLEFEAHVRKWPEQWLWMHRRWRR